MCVILEANRQGSPKDLNVTGHASFVRELACAFEEFSLKSTREVTSQRP
jgi:hypothetical protein